MASDEAKRLHARRIQASQEYKGVLAEVEGRAFSVDERTKLDTLDKEMADLDARIKSTLDADKRSAEADDAFAALEKRNAQPGMAPLGSGWLVSPDVQAWSETRSGSHTVEVGRQRRGPINTRTLLSNSTNSASATVPVDFYDTLISYLIEVSGILQTGPTVLNTAGGETLQIPTVQAHPTANTAAQAGAIAVSDPTFALKTLAAQKFGTSLYVARELIDDTAVDLLGYLAMACGRALGNTFGSALLLGGNGISGGLISSTSVAVTSAPSASIATAAGQVAGGPSYKDLVTLQYSVIAPYRQSRSCYWLASDQSLGQLRLLTDTVGRPLWEPSTVLGSPDMILGKPIVADPFMPGFGAGNKSLAFGDFSQYFVRLVGGLRFERSDDFSFDTDRVAFRALLRGDGNLADANAIKLFQGNAN